MKEKVSVLIPTYNVALFVEEAVRSIMEQTYNNLEIVIVDDCSTDFTYSILEKLAKEDCRVKLFRNGKNRKIAETLNFAFSVSTGKYIARMDGDDISIPNRIEKLVDFLQKNRAFDLVGSKTITIDERGYVIGESFLPIIEENVYKALICRMSPVLHIWLTKREVYEKVGNYRIPPAEDYDFLLRAKTLNFRFTNVNEFLYKVRVRSGNTATTQGLRQRLASELVYQLYCERERYGKEKTEDKDFERKLTVSKITNNFFKFSNKFLVKSVENKNNKVIFLIYLLGAILFSPYYQIKYLFFRYKYKKLD